MKKNINTKELLFEMMGKVNPEFKKKQLNESYVMKDDRFSFRQRINNSTFFNYEGFTSEFDSDITQSDIIVNWKISFWLNDSGVENLIIDVDSVEGTYTLEQYNKQSGELEQSIDKNIADVEWKFIVDNASLSKGGSLYISTLDFDFSKQTCDVSFYKEQES
jgi:hypothetical protein